MCGFSGLLKVSSVCQNDELLVNAALENIRQRGPDQSGTWIGEQLVLGHQRLSIHDLSDLGKQPMVSACERYVIVFNGEIYNYEELREQLVGFGYRFKGNSDTEVLLAAFAINGVDKTLPSLVGMYALALWDRLEENLTLARDRFGEKPLYYGFVAGRLVFGSQLNSLPFTKGEAPDIDLGSLELYFRHGYIPAPYTIYQNVRKLEPGCLVTANSSAGKLALSEPQKYWDALSFLNRKTEKECGSVAEITRDLDQLINQSVALQAKADVPLGCFLSGGIDSSTVASVLQSQSSGPIDTFTIGFDDPKYNEACFAKEVAGHIGSKHHELFVNKQNLLDVVPTMSTMFDEPFSDASQIPTFLAGQLAKKHVTVALSGDGGDELFCGYNRYFSAFRRWQKINRIPRSIRSGLEGLLNGFSLKLALSGSNFLKDSGRAVEYFASPGFREFYRRSVSSMHNPKALINYGCKKEDKFFDARLEGVSALDYMMALDVRHYMADDILVKVDRAFMASSLEGRIPLLDHRIFEFAWSLPLALHTFDGRGKFLLRQVLNMYVPQGLYDRPKTGFGVPLAQWLRNDLKDWAYCGIAMSGDELNKPLVFKMWKQHQSGAIDWSGLLWSLANYNYWKHSSA
jgi:asparagine synthase (glutamine-hydrolysing)